MYKRLITTLVLAILGLTLTLLHPKDVHATSYTPDVSEVDDWSTGFTIMMNDYVTVDNELATEEVAEAGLEGPTIYGSVWYKFIPHATGTYTADTCSTVEEWPDTVIALYREDGAGTLAGLTYVTENDESPTCSPFSEFDQYMVEGETYYFQVGGYFPTDTDWGEITFHLYSDTVPDPPPDISAYDDFPGYEISLDEAITVDNTDASNEIGEPRGTDIIYSLWYKFIPASSGSYIASTCILGGPDTKIALYESGDPDTLANLTELDYNDDSEVDCASDFGSVVIYDLTGGTTYYYQVGSFGAGDVGEIYFTIVSNVVDISGYNNFPGYTIAVDEEITVDNTTGSNEPDEPNTGNLVNSLWYKHIPSASGTYLADTCIAGGNDTVMYLYQAGAPDSLANLVQLDENDDAGGNCPSAGSRIEYSLTSGVTYYYQVGSYSGDDLGNIYFTLSYTPPTAGLIIDDDTMYTSTPGNFVFTGNAQGIGNVISVEWRLYSSGQGAEIGWSNCSATDGSYNSDNEDYTCTIPTTNTDGEYHFEIRMTDASSSVVDHLFPVGMLENSPNVDAWLSFSNITNAGLQAGDSRSFGSPSVFGSPVLLVGEDESDGAIDFDGNTYFEFSDSTPYLDYAGTDRSFALNAKIYPDSSGDGGERYIFSKRWPGTQNSSFWSVKINADNTITTTLRFKEEDTYFTTPDTVNLDEWNDIQLSFDIGNNMSCLKINDSLATCAAWLNPTEIYPSNFSVRVGGEDGLGGFIGLIDNMTVTRTGDATPPIVSIEALEIADRVTTSAPTFDVALTDTNSGVASAEYCLGWTEGSDCTWIPISAPTDGDWGGTNEAAVISLSGLSDNTHTLTVRSTDNNGNRNVNEFFTTSKFFQASYTFTIEAVDSTAPRIYANSVSPNPGIETKPSIRGYVKDYLVLNEGDTISNIATISYSLDGGSFTSISALDGAYNSSREDFYFRVPSDLSIGAHSIRIRAKDSAGNNTGNNAVNQPLGDIVLNFTVSIPNPNQQAENIVQEITFSDHDSHDTIFSDAVWGNGIIRLRQKIDFASAIDYSPDDATTFGYTFGYSSLGIYPSTDGNIWVGGNDGGIIYYNTITQTATKYDKDLLKGAGSEIGKIFEFEDGGNRYLMIQYLSYGSTIIYDIKNTPENTADDVTPFVDLANVPGFLTGYENFSPHYLDSRTSNLAIYGIIEGTSDNVMRLDMNGTPMTLADDTFTVWGHSLGSGDDENSNYDGSYTSFYFDQDQHIFLGFHYTNGMYICDDNDTPTNTGDDSCTTPFESGAVTVTNRVFAVTKDPNGWYWIGGDNGIVRLDINGTIDRTDDYAVWVLTNADIAEDDISAIKWVEGEYPVGDEVWVMTRSGRIRAIEYNGTYDDSLDDTTYKYKIGEFDYRAGGVSTFYMQDKNTIWVGVPGLGLEKVELTRGYENSNIIEIYPSTPEGLLEIDEFLLSNVLGTVSNGSVYTLSDLVTYEVSTDAGITWRNVTVGESINFTNSDYRLKIRITLHSGSTPILESLQLSFVAQPKGTIEENLNSENDSTTPTSNPSSDSTSYIYSMLTSTEDSEDSDEDFIDDILNPTDSDKDSSTSKTNNDTDKNSDEDKGGDLLSFLSDILKSILNCWWLWLLLIIVIVSIDLGRKARRANRDQKTA